MYIEKVEFGCKESQMKCVCIVYFLHFVKFCTSVWDL